MNASSKRYYRFGPFEADLLARELFERDGARVNLQDKPFEVLATLLQRAGDVVLREELYDRLWPDQIVEYETNLSTAVAKLRRALGDTGGDARFIETLPGRGYRLSVPATASAEPGERALSRDGRAIRRQPGRALVYGSLAAAALAVAFLSGWNLRSDGGGAHALQRPESPARARWTVESRVGDAALDGHDPRRCPGAAGRSSRTAARSTGEPDAARRDG